MNKDKEVQICEVIISKQLLRGNGINEPYRHVLQVFTKEGNFIAENDPITYTATDLVKFANFHIGDDVCTLDDVNKWGNVHRNK